MAKILVQVFVAMLLLLVAVAGATPPGIANNPSHATCNIKKYKHCYNLVHVCPKFCPDGCTVECASCKPICVGASNPPPNSSPTPSTPSTPENPPSSTPSTPDNPPPSNPSTPENPPPSTPSTPENPPPTPSTPENPPPSTPSTPENPPPTPSTPENPPTTTPSPENPPPSTPTPSTPENPPTITPSPENPPPSTPTPGNPPPSPSTPSTPQNPAPSSPSTPSTSENLPPSPSTPSSPENPTPSPSSPSTPGNPPPATPSPTPTPSSPSPSTPSPTTPPSSPTPSPKRARCKNKNYPKCYNMEHACPSACPGGCEVDCYTCKPVCKCDKPGAVCQDPRFIGGDGITFYFHGKKDTNFCLVSDPNLHINAHFIGRRNHNMNRDFTWVQSIAILFDNHQLFIGAQKTATWHDSIDRLTISFDGEPITIAQSEGATWQSPTGGVSIARDAGTNSVTVEVEGKMKVTAKVVPITEQDSRVHKYGIIEGEDCFAHLDLGFKFLSLSNEVSGVLGQTYRPNYVNRVNIGVKMPVMGGVREFKTSNLFSADCSVARFVGNSNNVIAMMEDSEILPGLSCEGGVDGQGVVCKR